MKSKRSCPICKNTNVEFLHTQKFELPTGHPLADGYEVAACVHCGFVFADTAVSQADYDRFYTEHSKYEDAKTGTGGVSNPFDWKRQQETGRQIADFLQDTNLKILDVGCANGGMLKALRELGYENLCGLDPSPVCVENTRQLGLEAQQGSLFHPFRENTYDCVILSHTLEHVEDVRGALDWILEQLKTGGVIFLETPDASRYVDFNYAPFQEFNTEHINHFSLASLKSLMSVGGFELVQGGAKTLQTAPQIQYPAVYGFWKYVGNDGAIKKDDDLKGRIEQYIQQSGTMINQIKRHLQKSFANSPEIIVWGTGQLTMKLLLEAPLAEANILAFVDSNPINQGKTLRGIRIISPQEVFRLSAPILVSSTLHQNHIVQQIKDMGLPNPLIFLSDHSGS
jgi:2-polyprenyl-3-methyl-5-hydroxy-6-metoxy-1,4-benzoquinol methylase